MDVISSSTADNKLSCIARQFPIVHIDFYGHGWHTGGASAFLPTLAAAPSGCLQAVQQVTTMHYCGVPATCVAELIRLCPQLQQVEVSGVQPDSRGSVSAALSSLRGLAAPLQVLHLTLDCEESWTGHGPSSIDAARAAIALACLTGLQGLRLDLRSMDPGERLLQVALPALTALSTLELHFENARLPEPQLIRCPSSLRALKLEMHHCSWGLGVLKSAGPLPGVTRLELSTQRWGLGRAVSRKQILAAWDGRSGGVVAC